MTTVLPMPFQAVAEMIGASPSILAALPAGNGALQVGHALYDFAVDGGAIGPIIPAQTVIIPDNAILLGATFNSTGALTSSGAATIAIGLSAGAAADDLLAATAVASYSADAVINTDGPTFAAPIKMTAAGSVQLTVAAFALLTGVLDIFVYYVVPNA